MWHPDLRHLVRVAAALAVLVCGLTAGAQLPADGVLRIGRVDSVRSVVLKEQRKYLVYTPPSYGDTTYLPRAYPVLYLLDGDAHFHSVTGMLQILGTGVNGTFVLPEMIVVAIPNTDRMRDLSPTRVSVGLDGRPSPMMATTGGMRNFLEFLRTELIPHIEARYRAAPYRVFVGHSLGGITAINALYTMPTVFNAYVAIDPSLWWDNELLLREARQRLAQPGLEGRTLYVAQANTINPADTTLNRHFTAIAQFDGVAKEYKAPGLRYGFKYYDQDDHGSVPMIAEYDALRFIFASHRGSLGRAVQRPASLREHYVQISRDLGYDHGPPEALVDMLGLIAPLVDSTKTLEFFQMNAELYPQSPNVHARLAGVWTARGDTTRAIAAYERALVLKPGRRDWQDALARLRSSKRP